jgi:hypothetical protein
MFLIPQSSSETSVNSQKSTGTSSHAGAYDFFLFAVPKAKYSTIGEKRGFLDSHYERGFLVSHISFIEKTDGKASYRVKGESMKIDTTLTANAVQVKSASTQKKAEQSPANPPTSASPALKPAQQAATPAAKVEISPQAARPVQENGTSVSASGKNPNVSAPKDETRAARRARRHDPAAEAQAPRQNRRKAAAAPTPAPAQPASTPAPAQAAPQTGASGSAPTPAPAKPALTAALAAATKPDNATPPTANAPLPGKNTPAAAAQPKPGLSALLTPGTATSTVSNLTKLAVSNPAVKAQGAALRQPAVPAKAAAPAPNSQPTAVAPQTETRAPSRSTGNAPRTNWAAIKRESDRSFANSLLADRPALREQSRAKDTQAATRDPLRPQAASTRRAKAAYGLQNSGAAVANLSGKTITDQRA